MPKWEIRIERRLEQRYGGRTRTVGTYQVYHDDVPVTATVRVEGKDVHLFGTTAEAAGPSQNDRTAEEGFPTRIVARTYPMQTSGGPTYVTDGYRADEIIRKKMPGLELSDTGRRDSILIHPGKDEFRSTVGCINLCTHLNTPDEIINYKGSRRRVIALIEDMKAFLGGLPGPDRPIPGAYVTISETALADPQTLAANLTRTSVQVPAAAIPSPEGIAWPLRRNVIRRNIRNHTYGPDVRIGRDKKPKAHQGWDLLAPVGTECFAVADGKINLIYSDLNGYGHVVELAFSFKNQPLFAAYAHLSAVKVKEGQAVAKGQLIGLTGDSGNAGDVDISEKHLHFEIRTMSRPGGGLTGRKDPKDLFGTVPLKEAVIADPGPASGSASPAPPVVRAAPAPTGAAAVPGLAALDRKPIFDAVKIMLGRRYTKADVPVLDEGCDRALASVPFDRKPIFDAARILLGRSFETAEVAALDRACDLALTAAAKPPEKALAEPRPPQAEEKTVPGRHVLGSLSEIYESGNRGPDTVSPGIDDPGGVSYGCYQLSSKKGTLGAFLRNEGQVWAAEFGTAAPGSAAFSKAWKIIGAREADRFRGAQHAFIERTHYRPAVLAVLKSTGLDLDSRHDAIRDATWSVSVQHQGAPKILADAVAAADRKAARTDPRYDRLLAEAVYEARIAYVLKVAASSKLPKGQRDQLISITKKRFPSERDACLNMFG
jgi:murein DD-endopeptidase MepM/ murein hydrolase activator NlpD